MGPMRARKSSLVKAAEPSRPFDENKQELVSRMLKAKEKSGKTFTQIAAEIHCTNLYTAALFHNQHQLKAGKTEELLLASVPGLKKDGLIDEMKKAPWY